MWGLPNDGEYFPSFFHITNTILKTQLFTSPDTSYFGKPHFYIVNCRVCMYDFFMLHLPIFDQVEYKGKYLVCYNYLDVSVNKWTLKTKTNYFHSFLWYNSLKFEVSHFRRKRSSCFMNNHEILCYVTEIQWLVTV